MKKLLLMTALAGVSAFGAFAQEKSADAAQIPADATMMSVAGQLVKYGYDKGQALPLIQAAEIYQTLGAKDFTEAKTEEGDSSAADNESKESKVSYDVPQLLADATELADGNEHLLALINDVKNMGTRGATSNYGVHTDRVGAYRTDVYNIRFYGGSPAMVIVSGDGDTDLDLYVYSPNGTLVAKDDDYTDDCVATWIPARTQTYTIKIKNRGRVYNQYRMAVN